MYRKMDLRDKDNISKVSPLSNKGVNYHHTWLRNRELGNKNNHGTTDRMLREMYSTIRPVSQWDSLMSSNAAVTGCIFNLEFSPDGVLMVAACEKKNILLFDANTQKHIHSVDNAHADCVNCVRFLDTRMFATCSDDSTVALWDTRNLKSKIRVLYGHQNWVKNVEYSKNDKLLVTSGFDGSIFTWDINSYTERGLLYRKAFHTNGLMRMKLHPDANKMIICTSSGYLMIVHDLDLETLPTDLYGFKPNMYRLMQISETTIPVAAKYTHLFNPYRKRNRVELISDFPRGDEAEVISSLQIHPQGWCVLSRNITSDERSEWTCVHNIQENATKEYTKDLHADYWQHSSEDNAESSRLRSQPTLEGQSNRTSEPPSEDHPASVLSTDIWEALLSIHESRERSNILLGAHSFSNNMMPHGVRIVRVSSGIEDPFMYEEEVDSSETNSASDGYDAAQSTSNNNNSSSSNEESHSESAIAGSSDRMDVQMADSSSSSDAARSSTSRERQTIIIFGSRRPIHSSLHRMVKKKYTSHISPNHRHKIHQNSPRLSHYIEETNAGKGFIKEAGFSQDGRIICSPFSYGVRLLAFNEMYSELSSCAPSQDPVPLYEIGTSAAHNDVVLCTNFSPRHCMLVSGDHSGNIVWYQPYL